MYFIHLLFLWIAKNLVDFWENLVSTVGYLINNSTISSLRKLCSLRDLSIYQTKEHIAYVHVYCPSNNWISFFTCFICISLLSKIFQWWQQVFLISTFALSILWKTWSLKPYVFDTCLITSWSTKELKILLVWPKDNISIIFQNGGTFGSVYFFR